MDYQNKVLPYLFLHYSPVWLKSNHWVLCTNIYSTKVKASRFRQKCFSFNSKYNDSHKSNESSCSLANQNDVFLPRLCMLWMRLHSVSHCKSLLVNRHNLLLFGWNRFSECHNLAWAVRSGQGTTLGLVSTLLHTFI